MPFPFCTLNSVIEPDLELNETISVRLERITPWSQPTVKPGDDRQVYLGPLISEEGLSIFTRSVSAAMSASTAAGGSKASLPAVPISTESSGKVPGSASQCKG